MRFATLNRSFVLLTSISLLLPSWGWALWPPTAFSIPASWGKITDSFPGDGVKIICLEDLHCNYPVQKNLAKIIQRLVKETGVHLAGVEGAVESVNLSLLADFPLPKIRAEVGDYFLRQGMISGVEYFAVTHPGALRLEGIEQPELYQSSLKMARRIVSAEAQGLCVDLRERLRVLKPIQGNSRLRRAEALKIAFLNGRLNFRDYGQKLLNLARSLGMTANRYPGLASLGVLPRPFFFGDPDLLQKEILRLETDLQNRLALTPREKNLYAWERVLDTWEKMLAISASPEEIATYRRQADRWNPNTLAAFLHAHHSPAPHPGDLTLLSKQLNEADVFYQTTDQRSHWAVINLLKQMRALKESVAVLLAGGFHTSQLVRELRRQNIGYLVIRPAFQIWRDNPYFSLLLGTSSPLDQLLFPNPGGLALPNAWKTLGPDASITAQALALADLKTDARQPLRTFQQKHAGPIVSVMTYAAQASANFPKLTPLIPLSSQNPPMTITVLPETAPPAFAASKPPQAWRRIGEMQIMYWRSPLAAADFARNLPSRRQPAWLALALTLILGLSPGPLLARPPRVPDNTPIAGQLLIPDATAIGITTVYNFYDGLEVVKHCVTGLQKRGFTADQFNLLLRELQAKNLPTAWMRANLTPAENSELISVVANTNRAKSNSLKLLRNVLDSTFEPISTATGPGIPAILQVLDPTTRQPYWLPIPGGLVAAPKELPLGSKIEIELPTGKKLQVKVGDRGGSIVKMPAKENAAKPVYRLDVLFVGIAPANKAELDDLLASIGSKNFQRKLFILAKNAPQNWQGREGFADRQPFPITISYPQLAEKAIALAEKIPIFILAILGFSHLDALSNPALAAGVAVETIQTGVFLNPGILLELLSLLLLGFAVYHLLLKRVPLPPLSHPAKTRKPSWIHRAFASQV